MTSPFFHPLHALNGLPRHNIMNPRPAIPARDPAGKSITAITPTGDRPLAFALCQNWVKNQTVQPDQWIVVDDGKVPLQPIIPMDYVRREPKPTDPKHTLALNLKTAIPLIKGDKIIIIEDDEYYAPTYIEEMAHYLNKYRVVGIMRSKYYHIFSGGYAQFGNTGHASLAQTAFRSSFLPKFEGFVKRGMFTAWLDTQIWKTFRIPISQILGNEKVLDGGQAFLFIDIKKPLYLGVKGLPGRLGIGQGHNINMYHSWDSRTREMLKKWVPNDYQIYLDIIGGKLNENNYQEYFGWQ